MGLRSTIAPLFLDSYKLDHRRQYPPGTTMVYSNMTPRKSRVPGVKHLVVAGPQYYVLRYLMEYWNEYFFGMNLDEVLKIYARRVGNFPGPSVVPIDHIAELHEWGSLPVHIKALSEGTLCPMRVPYLTIRNTKDWAYWVTNMLETQMSNILWQMPTSATTAFQFRKTFERYAKETGGDMSFVRWQAHDFSVRGLSGLEAAWLSGMGHAFSSYGTDNVPCIDPLEWYYGADVEKETVGGSVFATEHSVMCMGGQEGEFGTLKRLITEVYPGKGPDYEIVSIVSDTWNLFKLLIEYVPALRQEILARNGKVVFRPDSGDPVKILCGDPESKSVPKQKGTIRLLHEVFGGSVTDKGYKVLDPHVGSIYGDAINAVNQVEICERLKAQGFASTNDVLGVGSFSYQYVTRDTYGIAIKATYGTVNGEGRALFKDPETDDGTKKSATGLLKVEFDPTVGDLVVRENVDWSEEAKGLLHTIYNNGKAYNFQTLAEIRRRLDTAAVEALNA